MGSRRRFGAIYSPCGLYRYRLWRAWGRTRRTLTWIMLNPSTADHLGNNDATIERCERRAATWGFDRMEVVNLFALRSPSPRALRDVADPVGPENDRAIVASIDKASMILCGWGLHGAFGDRAAQVRDLLDGRRLSCLGVTRSGEPMHPLYIPYSREPIPYSRTFEHQ